MLVAYLCVGDPSVDESVELAQACVRAGADVIELGVPFSDPTADGPAIALASQRALASGGGLEATLRAARSLRAAEPDVGIVLFGYYNPLFVRGEAKAARDAAEAGVDALLVVDLPIEESGPLRRAGKEHGLGFVPLLAPTSRADRVAAVRETAADSPVPFVYYVTRDRRDRDGRSRRHASGSAGSRAARRARAAGRRRLRHRFAREGAPRRDRRRRSGRRNGPGARDRDRRHGGRANPGRDEAHS